MGEPGLTGWSGRLAEMVATVGGAGRFPVASGTFGTLVTLPLCAGVVWLGPLAHGVVFVLVTVVGIWAAERVSRAWGRKDPREVVVDESAGILLATWWMPTVWPWWVNLTAAFFLFRLFDVWKPWPANWLDRNLPGGWGIMLDDLAAGLYAAGALWALSRWV